MKIEYKEEMMAEMQKLERILQEKYGKPEGVPPHIWCFSCDEKNSKIVNVIESCFAALDYLVRYGDPKAAYRCHLQMVTYNAKLPAETAYAINVWTEQARWYIRHNIELALDEAAK